MPRALPLLGDRFDEGCQVLRNFSRRIELNHDALKTPNSGLTISGVELTYELLFLKVFLLWENFQQEVFVRLLMGYQSNGGVDALLPGVNRCTSLAAAELVVLGGRSYRLWHDPNQVLTRCDQFFDPAHSHFRNVIGANAAALSNFAAIRHGIAHAQSHARAQFDAATMSLVGKRYGGQAGRFLREMRPDNRRWFDYICDELSDISHQIA